MKRIIFEGSNIGSYIRPQERPPFGFKLSETRAKTNGPSLDHLAPAGHAAAPMLIHANSLAIFAPHEPKLVASHIIKRIRYPRSPTPQGKYRDIKGNICLNISVVIIFNLLRTTFSSASKIERNR